MPVRSNSPEAAGSILSCTRACWSAACRSRRPVAGVRTGRDLAAVLPATSHNGSSKEAVRKEAVDGPLAVPRDRLGTVLGPRLVPKIQRRLCGLDEMIVSFYAGGVTIRDIQHHLASTISTEQTHVTTS